MKHFKQEIQQLCGKMEYPTLHIPAESTGLQTWIKPQEIEFLMRKHIELNLFNNGVVGARVRSVKDGDGNVTKYEISQGEEVVGVVPHDTSMIKVVETPFTGDTVLIDTSHWLENEVDFLYNDIPYHKICNDHERYGHQRFQEVLDEEYYKIATAGCCLQILPVVEDGKLAGLTVLIIVDNDVVYYKLFK